jgi:hypothetical protein
LVSGHANGTGFDVSSPNGLGAACAWSLSGKVIQFFRKRKNQSRYDRNVSNRNNGADRRRFLKY